MGEMKLKPFDKVLVRDGNKGAWTPDIFKFYDNDEFEKPFTCIGGNYSQCIAYEKK